MDTMNLLYLFVVFWWVAGIDGVTVKVPHVPVDGMEPLDFFGGIPNEQAAWFVYDET